MQPRLFQPSDSQADTCAVATVGDVAALYLRHATADQNARTFADRRHVLLAFTAAHVGLELASAKPYHLRLWTDAQTQWKSDWTKKRGISTVQRAFNWAVKLGIIDRNPFWGVSHRAGEYGRAMTDSEFQDSLRSSSQPFRRLLMFLRYTGCRPSEAAGIEPRHVDLNRSLVILDSHKTARTLVINRPRVIVLHPVAEKLLRHLLRIMIPGQSTLFINYRGTRWTRYALACRMKRLRRALSLPKSCRLYGLRHKFGTDAIRNKVEIKTLSVLMGHATTRVTERYVHIENEFKLLGEAVRQAVRHVDP